VNQKPRARLACVVLTFNEEANIEPCLQSAQGLGPIVVVDSGSTDGTRAICERYTRHFLVHPYRNHAQQWQWALEHLPLEAEWVLALDADFVVTPELAEALRDRLDTIPADVAGVFVRHDYVFGGGRIRFGGTKRHWLRVVRAARARADLSDLVDFRFVVDGGTERWDAAVIEYNRYDDDISVWLAKQDKFSLRLAVEDELRRRGRLGWEGRPDVRGNPDQRTMWLRDRFLHLPLFLRGVLYFVYRYVIMLGFLDGRAGFLYHFLQGWWLRTVVDWKIVQLRRLGLSDGQLAQFRDAMLSTRTGSVGMVCAALSGDPGASAGGAGSGT